MRKLHILFLASWYPNRDAPALGNFIQRHARAAALHHTISVVHVYSDAALAEGEQQVEETHTGDLHEYGVRYGKIRSSLPLISQLKKRNVYRAAVKAGMARVIDQHNAPDILHVHVIWPMALAALPLIQEPRNIPLVITEHWSGYLPEDGNYKGYILKNYSQKLVARASHITVVSKRMQEAMMKQSLNGTFSLLPNAVDTTLFAPVGKDRQTENKKLRFRLLHVSMLVDREKNISGLLRVMKKLEGNAEITLDIAGDGPERETHMQHARELDILDKTVFFRGYKSPAEVAVEMGKADALVMFSHFEGMPVSIIEAQCCGLPVIATKTGSIPEMVNAQQGILVEPGDEAALEKAIRKLVEQHDSFSAEQIRNTAVHRYSMEAVGAQLDQLYRSILEKDGR